MNENLSYNVVTEGTGSISHTFGSDYSDTSTNFCFTCSATNNYLLYVALEDPVAELNGSLGSNENKIKIQLNKKLNFVQRMLYSLLGFKYKKL